MSAKKDAAAAAGLSSGSAHASTSASPAHRHSNTAVPPSSTGLTTGPAQMRLVSQCDWVDRTLWATRQIFGGNSINGFLRSSATTQRIKRQRARQMASTKKANEESGAGASGASADPGSASNSAAASIYKYDPKKPFDPVAEEQLKKEIMNPRTIKKMKTELEAGVNFCVTLQKTLLGIIADIDPSKIPQLPPPLTGVEGKVSSEDPIMESLLAKQNEAKKSGSTRGTTSAASTQLPKTGLVPGMTNPTMANPVMSINPQHQPHPFASGRLPRAPMPKQNVGISETSASSPGNPEGSTLRKHRKKKLPSSSEDKVQVPEVDHAGKRYVTKKEHNFRICEMYRFRPLKAGDFVAARLTSRDLWILARVLKDYSGCDMPPLEFLQLSVARRDGMFRDKVHVKDVEDKESGSATVSRSLVLPLPRTYSEASEWGKRYKKDSRVYAMYPQTTSLYPATVIDSTTYCRGDDDMIVAEFDGEEADALTGIVPKYHIPARFVVMIPREFAAAQIPPTGSKSSNKRKSSSSTALQAPSHSSKRSKSQPQSQPQPQVQASSPMDDMLDFDDLDLDFSKPLPEGAEVDDMDKDFMMDPHF